MKTRKMKDSRTSRIILHNVGLGVLAFIWLIPIIWLVCTSFSSFSGMNTSTFFPKEWGIKYYIKLFHPDTVAQFPQWFMNTFVVACATCVISTMFVLMVAYATSIMRFPMRKPLMNLAVILNLFPGMLAMIAVYFVLKTFNLTNSYAGLIMVYSASSGLGYLIAKGFFDTVPRALCEAARIDGCSEARIFFQMVIPMSRPIVVYTVISSFLVPWMDFVYAKMILNAGVSSKFTVAIGLYKMLDKMLINDYFTQFCAGGVLVSVPISVLFMIMQKFYVEGITGGAVKG
ncbi:MAG TPA: sugar ABC transporter permease [Lachnospiraceae bacterium]|nr:sugar ABC transporter permease [Lachnospiraceae bacterium]